MLTSGDKDIITLMIIFKRLKYKEYGRTNRVFVMLSVKVIATYGQTSKIIR